MTAAPAQTSAVAAPSRRTLVVPLRGGHGAIEVVLPEGFTHAVTQPPGIEPPIISFGPAGDVRGGRIMMKPEWSSGAVDDAASSTAARALLDRDVAEYGSANFSPVLPLPSGNGFWCGIHEEAAPRKRSTWSHYTMSYACASRTCVATYATALEMDSAVRREALAMMGSMRILASGDPAAAGAVLSTALAIPGASWQVLMDLPAHFTVLNTDLGDEGGPKVSGGDEQAGLSVTLFAGKQSIPGNAATFRDLGGNPQALAADLRASTRSKKAEVRDVRAWDEGDHAWVAHSAVVPKDGVHRSVRLVLVHDGSWITAHASKQGGTPADDPALEAILRTVRIAKP